MFLVDYLIIRLFETALNVHWRHCSLSSGTNLVIFQKTAHWGALRISKVCLPPQFYNIDTYSLLPGRIYRVHMFCRVTVTLRLFVNTEVMDLYRNIPLLWDSSDCELISQHQLQRFIFRIRPPSSCILPPLSCTEHRVGQKAACVPEPTLSL